MGIMDIVGDVDNSLEHDSDIDSGEEESICKSPQKSPRKLSSILKRKRKLSDSGPSSYSQTDSDPEDNDDVDDSIDDDDDEEEDVIEQSRSVTKKSDFQFKEPTFRKKQFIFHQFKVVDGNLIPDTADSSQPVTVTIPEQLAASYGLYIWPSAPVLAWYLWLNKQNYLNKTILELGAGTALPGILLAKIGCNVILSDSVTSPTCVNNCREAVKLNNLEKNVDVIPLSWGLITSKLLGLKNKLDFVIGSDLFFDPDVFEKLVFTIKWLLSNNPGCQFVCTVQERSADWSIELLLKKYNLRCSYDYPEQFLRGTGISPSDLTGDHTIFVLKIFLNS